MRREEVIEEGKVTGVAQWLDRKLPFFGSYSFCPKGPIGSNALEGTGHQIFLRIEPDQNVLIQEAHKSIDLDPAHTLITNLSATEDDLLAGMHQKTRYNIRVAGKHEVQISLHSADFDAVWNLFEQTSFRGQFRLHQKQYYQKMVEALQGGACNAFLATASHEGKIIASNIMIDFGDTRTYLHGASSNTDRNLMGPYLLHWELLRDARAQGIQFYDWWGVAPEGADDQHPWAGISRFKRGFGGEEVEGLGTYDHVIAPLKYYLYQMARHVRRLR
ncbi:peptidoglycan bridge formation glycyltransferase FemA/FemB family protein [Candidatus Uhrbacteria bacterium]|nr:peptidoglycan bridge formation glycyltransferase FemA/FemB family protein [Candidatus Uhrbacteria bacterium]